MNPPFLKLVQNLVCLTRSTLLLVILLASTAKGGGVYDGPGVKAFYLPFSASSVVKVTRYVDHLYPANNDDHELPLWWFSPTPGDKTSDLGTDFGAVPDTEVRAAASGTVIAIQDGYLNSYSKGPGKEDGGGDKGDGGSYGNYVVIEHDDVGPNKQKVVTLYAHLNKDSLFDGKRSDLKHIRKIGGEEQLAQGSRVKAGDYIGRVGFSGNTYGYHLHFGVFVDPSVTREDRYFTGESLGGGTIGAGTGYVVDPFSSDTTKQWWVSQNATKYDPYAPPSSVGPVMAKGVFQSTGTAAANAKVEIDGALACYADDKGFFTIPKEFITGALQWVKVTYGNLKSEVKQRLISSATPSFAADETMFTAELKSTSTASLPTNRFSIGDNVEVFGTGNGLRARYPDPGSEPPKVMADGAAGTVVGGPITGDGYVRWKIRYDALAGIEAWSAEGEPSTGQMFLRKRSGGGANIPKAPAWVTATASSTSQINVSWTNQASNATGIRVYRSTSGGSYENVKTLGASVSAWTDTNRAAGTTYNYRLRSFSAAGESKDSNIATAKTPPATGGVYSLAVDAVDLGASQILAVNVSSWTGSSSDFRNNTTSFTRQATAGNQLTVSAPATLTGGRYFQYWTLDAASRIYGSTATASMTGNHNLIAIYGSTPPPARTLSSISIEGPSSVNERDSATYKAKATFSDGSSAYVSPKWEEDSSYTHISSGGVFDVDAIPFDKTVDLKATYKSGGNEEIGRKVINIRNTDVAATYTLTKNASAGGYIRTSPNADSYDSGTVVSIFANADSAYVFSHWSGDASGTNPDTTVRMDRNRTVTANFVLDSTEGRLQVNLLPVQAAGEGAQWKYRNYNTWRDSGNTQNNIPPGNGYVQFKDISGWVTPDEVQMPIVGGQTKTVNATYREILGAVQVTIMPPEAAQGGARWRLDGGTWQESQTTLKEVATGGRLLEFKDVAGWATPAARTVTASRGLPTIITENYGAPAGLPLITSIAPNTGPIEGGTPISIEGTNFRPGTTVSFGGIAATNVVVTSETSLTATLPSRTAYGTVDVAVVSGGQTALRQAGFTYDIPLGMNMTLLGQIGGSVQAVAAQGNLVVFGEGSSIVAADYSNPASPVIRSRLPLPGIVRDIRIDGNLALVANHQWGLQIVDISNPAAMRKVGFYDTVGAAVRLALYGKRAYIAEQGDTGANGLLVLDYTNPAAPTKVTSFGISGTVFDIGLTTIGRRQIACVSTQYAGVAVIDVTNTANIRIVSTLEVGVLNSWIAVGGNYAFITGAYDGTPSSADGKLYDLSIPEQPVKRKEYLEPPAFHSSNISMPYLYIGDDMLRIYDLSNPANITRRSSLTLKGDTSGMSVSAGRLMMANGADGLMAVNVNLPTSPSILSTYNLTFDARDVTVADNIAYIALGGGSSGPVQPIITAVDVATRTSPRRLGTASFTSSVDSVLRTGGQTYGVSQTKGTAGFNFQNPSAPTQTSVRATDRRPTDAALIGQNIVLGGYTQIGSLNYPSIAIYDGINPSNATPLASLQISPNPGSITSVCAAGSYIFAFTSSYELKVINVSTLTSPTVVATLAVAAYPLSTALTVDGNYLFAADSNVGLSIFDCSIKTAPRLITNYARNNYSIGEAVAVRGSLVFYADLRDLNVLDCSNPANPLLVAAYDLPGSPKSVFVEGDDVFVADGAGGMEILRLGDVSRPNIEITSPTRNSSYEVSLGVITVGGTASDIQGITRVTWKNNRGGSGVATGTTSWSTANISLVAGSNVITMTAEDTTGNVASDTITVLAAFPDITAPVVTILGPRPEAEFASVAETITLLGSVADNQQVSAVNWADNNGHGGTATLNAQSWSVSGMALQLGPNIITVTATDASGNSATDVATILRTLTDTETPTIAIEFPTAAAEFGTAQATLNVSGEASDDVGLKQIRWSNNRGGLGIATGTALWSVNGIVLQPGLNSVTLTVEDETGKISEDNVAVTYTPPDGDGDGIADAWEMQYFGNLTEVNVNTDKGASGISDLLKFAFGMNPTRPDFLALP